MESITVPISKIREKGVWHFQPYSKAVREVEAILEQSRFPTVRLGTLVESANRGFPQRGNFDTDEVLLIRFTNITQSGLDLSNVAYISAADHQKLPQTQLRPGDLVVSIVAPSQSIKAAVYTDDRPANINQNIARLRPNPGINPYYLAYYLNSQTGQTLLQSRMSGAIIRAISLSALLDLPIICPPLSEQQAIVSELQALQQQAAQLTQQAGTLWSEADQRFNRILKEAPP